jgi:hypothetical protein
MSIIYDMANAEIQSLPAENYIVDERAAITPELGVREVTYCDLDNGLRAVPIHLIHALPDLD